MAVKKTRQIAAKKSKVWAALADFPAIVVWAPNVDHSTATTTAHNGIGAVRRVQSGRITLLETIVDWQPEERLGYTLDGLPKLAGSVLTTWELAETGDSTRVTITSAIHSRPNPLGRIVARVLGKQLAKAANQMLSGLAAHVEESK
ncbi:MAG TPA: SRPBCC family protein [Mycobacteriales bacterium]|jgi:carbon monoxide dehydrogenase subunit G|nr:SRPBCC family protein [Mycobacteriales bacterium]HVX70969.1 SRPBCC family protein [Mycobacteriales bacterium]